MTPVTLERRFSKEDKKDAVIAFLETHHPSILEEIEDFLFGQMMEKVDDKNTISGKDFLQKYAS